MCAKHVAWLLSVLTVVSTATVSLQAQAYDPQSKPVDNSGRRLAMVIPALPHEAPVMGAIRMSGTGSKALNSGIPASSRISGSAKGTANAVFPVRVRLTPQAQATVASTFGIMKGVSDIVWKRVTDVASWVYILLKQSNEAPKVTPAAGMAVMPDVGIASMTPIADPGKSTQLVFTSSHRLMTVVGR